MSSLEEEKKRLIEKYKDKKYEYSQSVEGNFSCLKEGEFDWWKYKFYIKQIEKAEQGKHIEEHFTKQNLKFDLSKKFYIKKEVVFTAGGDLLSGSQITPETTKNLWNDIKDFYFNSDIVYANLETPIALSKPVGNAPKSVSEAPKLNGTKEMFDIFVQNGKGINFFSTANNHCMNQDEDGLIETLDFLEKEGYRQVGTARTPEEQNDIPITSINDINIGHVAYTFSLNGDKEPEGKEYMVNHIRLNKQDEDISLIKKHVKIAREKGADIVIAYLHWSLEFESYPIENVIKMAHRIVEECGIDIIIGNHPHVFQPIEKYDYIDKSSIKRTSIIAYSLGNLVADFDVKNSLISCILKFKFVKGIENGEEKTLISELKLMSIYTFKIFENNEFKEIRLLNFLKLIDELDSQINKYKFNEDEIKELYRLKDLFFKLIPEKHEILLKK